MVLASLSISAVTDDAAIAKSDQTSPVDIYTYDSHPDIAKVISITEPGNSCGAKTAQLTYGDSAGVRHVMQYLVMNTDCDHG